MKTVVNVDSISAYQLCRLSAVGVTCVKRFILFSFEVFFAKLVSVPSSLFSFAFPLAMEDCMKRFYGFAP